MVYYDRARSKISNSIEGTILYHYGEKRWNKMSKKERYDIIEDIVRDNSCYYGLTEQEIQEIIKIEKSKES